MNNTVSKFVIDTYGPKSELNTVPSSNRASSTKSPGRITGTVSGRPWLKPAFPK